MMINHILKSFGILLDAGYKSYGALSDNQLLSKAQLYAHLISSDTRITKEVIEEVTWRYCRGEITKLKAGETVPVGMDFPTAPEYLEACVQVWHSLYFYRAIGYTIDSKGCEVAHIVLLSRKSSEEENERFINQARRGLGLPVPEEGKPISSSRLAEAKALVDRTFKED
jgi:hypothetical protein